MTDTIPHLITIIAGTGSATLTAAAAATLATRPWRERRRWARIHRNAAA